MKQILELFKFQLDNKYVLFKQKNLLNFLKQFFKYLILIAAITLILFIILRKIVFLLAININAEFLAIVLLATQAITFVFAIGSVISSMYLSKDNELLMVMPVTFNQLFVSKILLIYIADLLFSLVYILPIFLSLGIIGQLPGMFYLLLLLFIPILPIFPIALASIIGIPIMFIIKYFKKHTLLSVVSLLVIVATVFVLYMSIVTSISGAMNIAEKQIETSIEINQSIKAIGASIPIYNFLGQSMFEISHIYYLIIFLFASLAIMSLCFLVIKPFYYKIATITSENTSTIKSKYKKFKQRKPFNALLINEIRSVFRSPGYIFQYFLFPLFMPIIVFTYDKLLISIAVNQAGQAMIFGSHVLVLTIIALMSNIISSTAISREGGTFYIAKTTPNSFYVQAMAKLTFNSIFTLVAIFITTIITLILTNLSPLFVIISGLSIMILSIGHICHSFDMDLTNPVLDWYDNSEISTIGKSTTKSIIYALALALVMCLVFVFCSSVSLWIALVLGLLIGLVYALGRIHLLRIRIKHYYNIMEV